MTLAITVTNNAGTPTVGAVATVSGTSGAAVTVFHSPADLPWPSGSWTSGGTRTGDGTVPLSLSQRHYFAIAKTASDCSLPVRFAVTDALASVATRCRNGVISILQSLDLAEIGTRVIGQIYLDETEGQFPCLYVYVGGGPSESEEPGLNGLDYIVYPIVIAAVDVHSPTDHRALPKFELWRQQITRAFRVRPPLGVPELAYVNVRPNAIADQRAAEYQKYAGLITLNCVCREPRGVGA
jgi:hypothetical protein